MNRHFHPYFQLCRFMHGVSPFGCYRVVHSPSWPEVQPIMAMVRTSMVHGCCTEVHSPSWPEVQPIMAMVHGPWLLYRGPQPIMAKGPAHHGHGPWTMAAVQRSTAHHGQRSSPSWPWSIQIQGTWSGQSSCYYPTPWLLYRGPQPMMHGPFRFKLYGAPSGPI